MYTRIQNEIAKIRRKYLDSAEEIVSGYQGEYKLSKDYEGRQIFELLQNADDAVDEASDIEGKVLITFDGKTLSVSNTGEKFSFRGIKSLLYPNASPKKIYANKIGCMGLGFRSVLTWTDSLIVATEDFSIQFSKEYAKEFLSSILNERPELKNDIMALTKEEWPIATLTCPRLLKDNVLVPGYATSIIMECHEELSSKIEDQIKSLEFEELVFLPNLKEIEIICNDYHKTFYKVVDGNDVSIEQIDNNTKESSGASWRLFKRTGVIKDEDGDNKDYEFIIAYDPEGERYGEFLYSYFKTEVQLSFPALIHGTFVLTSNRNDLEKENPINEQLIPLLADFMADTAVKVSEEQNECDYRPLSLIVASDTDIGLSLRGYGFDRLLKEKAREKRILPTICNRYISVNDSPKFSSDSFANILCPEVFPTLLKYSEYEFIDEYLKNDLKIPFYEYNEFCALINSNTEYYSIKEKAQLIKLIEDEYYYHEEDDAPDIFPHLIVDSNGESVITSAKVYPFPSEEQAINLPPWVNVRFLNQTLESELYEHFDVSGNRRRLVSELSRYNLDEYSFDRLLRSVVNQIDVKSLTKEKCSDILNWLWKYFCQDETRQEIPDVRVKVICRDGKIYDAKECYIGSELGNSLGERLVGLYSDHFVSIYDLHIKCDDNNRLIQFLEWIGVSKYPRMQRKTLKRDERSDFLDQCYPLYVPYDNRSYSQNEFSSITSVTVGTVENVDVLLEKADFNDLLAWMLLDSSINARISIDTEEMNEYSCIKGYPSRTQIERTVTPSYVKSYLKYYLSNTAWIVDENGNKCKPEYCCFEDNGLAPFIIVPNVDYTYIKKIVGRSCKKDIDAILSRVGVSDVFQEMLNSIVYETLLKLPELDPYCKRAKSLYRKIVREGLEPEEYAENNSCYDDFIENGSVAVHKNGSKFYTSIERAYYSDKKVFSDEILNNFNMFEMDAHAGEEKVQKLFGVKPLKYSKIKLEGTPVLHSLDPAFKIEYSQYLPFVYACRIGLKKANTNFRNLRSSKISLCSELKVRYEFEDEIKVSELNDYELVYFREKKVAYIKVPKNITLLSDLKQIFDFDDAIAEIVTFILDVNEDKGFYRDLFADNDSKREQRMRKDKGDDNLELLTEARHKFNEGLNLRDEFWMAIAESKRIRNISISTSDSEKLISALKLPQNIDEAIDFEDLNAPANIPALIPIFEKLDIDLDVFNTVSFRSIDATMYWKQQLKNKMLKYKKKYQAYIVDCVVDDDDCLKLYDQYLEEYDFTDPNIDNSLFVDIDKVFEDECGVSFKELDNYEDDEIDKIISEAKSAIDEETFSTLCNHYSPHKIETYIIFGKIELLLSPEPSSEISPNTTAVENSNNMLNNTELARRVFSSPSMGMVSVTPQAINKQKTTGTSSGGHQKRIHNEASDTRKKEIGLIGEAAVYRELLNAYPDARWVSGYAETAGYTDKGDDTCGYDIKYTDSSGIVQYVEVKASTDERISFDISSNELRKALENPSNYEVIFVVIGEDNQLKNPPYRLGHLFDLAPGEDLMQNSKFSIESEKYHIFAEREKVGD